MTMLGLECATMIPPRELRPKDVFLNSVQWIGDVLLSRDLGLLNFNIDQFIASVIMYGMESDLQNSPLTALEWDQLPICQFSLWISDMSDISGLEFHIPDEASDNEPMSSIILGHRRGVVVDFPINSVMDERISYFSVAWKEDEPRLCGISVGEVPPILTVV